MSIERILRDLRDPAAKWYVKLSFGGRRVYGNITGSDQTLYVCDDVICIPHRFSENFKWLDPATSLPGAPIFNLTEAWDHSKESGPNTSFPYDGVGAFIAGYRSYWMYFELTDGSTKTAVVLARRRTDAGDDAILVINFGGYISGGSKVSTSLNVAVSDPPTAHGYSVDTNGTRGTGSTTIGPNQYVLFYRGSKPGVDTSNYMFAVSPMGSSKMHQYEVFVYRYTDSRRYMPAMYLGIKAPKDMAILGYELCCRSGTMDSINISAGIEKSGPAFRYLDIDPYTYEGTNTSTLMGKWAEALHPMAVYVGWIEIDGYPKYYIYSAIHLKHSTKKERRAVTYGFLLYDYDTDEFIKFGQLNPITDVYSYTGEFGFFTYSPYPYVEPDAMQLTPPPDVTGSESLFHFITPDNIYFTYFTYNPDGYACDPALGFCNKYAAFGICEEIVGIYTDDETLSGINPRWMCALQIPGHIVGLDLQIAPLNNRTLRAGKTYIAIIRGKRWFAAGLSDVVLFSWFRKSPKVLTSDEVNSFLSVFPYTVRLVGEPITSSLTLSIPTAVTPGSTFVVTGYAPGAQNKLVRLFVVDASGNLVYYTTASTDSKGSFMATLTAPSSPGNYTVYAVVMSS